MQVKERTASTVQIRPVYPMHRIDQPPESLMEKPLRCLPEKVPPKNVPYRTRLPGGHAPVPVVRHSLQGITTVGLKYQPTAERNWLREGPHPSSRCSAVRIRVSTSFGLSRLKLCLPRNESEMESRHR
jgi:hypothetical protein